MKTLKGKIKNFLFNNEDYGVAVFTLLDNEKNSTVITGNIGVMKVGVIYEVEGENVVDRKRNQTSFVVSSIKQVKEFSKDVYIKYFSSSLFPSIGKKLATNIVEHYKKDIFKKILKNKDELKLIEDMTEVKANIVYDVVKEFFSENDILDKFINNNLKQEFYNYLQRNVDDSNEIRSILENNFYEFAFVNKLTPFEEVDKVALAFGVEEFSDERISWWANYLGNELLFRTGDTYFDLYQIRKMLSQKFFGFNENDFDSKLLYAKKNNILYFENKKIYTKESYNDEKFIADKLIAIENESYNIKDYDFEKYLEQVEKFVGEKLYIDNFKYNEEQVLAIRNFCENNISIVTGGPGTGKTTIIAGIVKMYELIFSNSNYSIAAPTGRAASRIKESSDFNAQTIHKLLRYIGNDNFEFCLERPLSKELLIIDECSMIDNHLFASLLRGITDIKKLVLVGDIHQLPSVSYGNLYEDVIESEKFSITKLVKNNRQVSKENKNSIIDLSTAIREEKINEFNFEDTNNVEFIFNDDSNELKKEILKIYTKNKPSNIEDEINDIQIIAPMYKEQLGIHFINSQIQNVFNPSNGKEFKRGEIYFRPNDKVMYIENDPFLELSNGDVGYIENLVMEKNKLKHAEINFSSRRKEITSSQFSKINLNYACSIHKTQGSEYKNVILVLDNSNNYSTFFLNKKMIYTAVTRAKNKLFILTSKDLFLKTCGKDMKLRRTTLKERICSL
ncbi:exodeoxyribonuclease V subunit alpha [Spiroplasma chinense]|uniref:Exodeoxyribonuclease V subunit alpha n=1 Tax=Spiroplasma chinense TaxID=216932 RepID=A0A5B9Y6D1_9MOLU|nr:AAA family ATPase [Spiroplasma chinense]QEH61817.1 exodeoxyribonuclease V subunit alpha [Spiroplasma chinense]